MRWRVVEVKARTRDWQLEIFPRQFPYRYREILGKTRFAISRDMLVVTNKSSGSHKKTSMCVRNRTLILFQLPSTLDEPIS
jgi:hypothetical protein